MAYFRRNPVTGKWTIFIEERRKKDRKSPEDGKCPYCPDQTDKNVTQIMSLDKNGNFTQENNWQVKVIPNGSPILRTEYVMEKKGIGVYDWISGVGAHEVIVENPKHDVQITEFDLSNIVNIFRTYQYRMEDLKNDSRLKYFSIYKNYYSSKKYGVWQNHSHSMLLAMPVIPPDYKQEIYRLRKYNEYHSRCLYCDMISQEIEEGERMVLINELYIAFVPFAAQFPYEIMIFPRKHFHQFSGSNDEFRYLAYIYRGVLKKINKVLKNPSYTVTFHSSPFLEKFVEQFHWHIDIKPNLREAAGLESGTKVFINTINPEKAAEVLRNAEI